MTRNLAAWRLARSKTHGGCIIGAERMTFSRMALPATADKKQCCRLKGERGLAVFGGHRGREARQCDAEEPRRRGGGKWGRSSSRANCSMSTFDVIASAQDRRRVICLKLAYLVFTVTARAVVPCRPYAAYSLLTVRAPAPPFPTAGGLREVVSAPSDLCR